jgi:hypothetical protein
MPLSESALDLLREALDGETNPHLQLILLAPFPIPPVVDVKSWVKRSSGQNLTTPDSPGAQPPQPLP